MADVQRAVEHACLAWDSGTATEAVEQSFTCRSVIAISKPVENARFCFLSVGSPIEAALVPGSTIHDRSGEELGRDALIDRLLDGEVTAVLAPPTPVVAVTPVLTLPDAFNARRQKIRLDNVRARFLLRQIGLEEVSSHRGAPVALYRTLAENWTHDLALCTDPAMMLTLGADRQRYVDGKYTERATDRLPRALGRLHGLGVRAHPRLVIV